VSSAEASLAKALALAPAGHPERAGLLERWVQAAQQQGRPQEARAALEEAIALYRERGESVAAGRALTALLTTLARLGDPSRVHAIVEAIALLEAQQPGPELVAAYGELAGLHVILSSAYAEAVPAGERALQLAAALDLPVPARALGFRGLARAELGEREGLDDMRRALALSVERGRGRDAAVIHYNLSEIIWLYEGPLAGLAACHDVLDFCERRGIAELALAAAALRLTFLIACGRPEEALAEAEPLAARAEAAGDVTMIEVRSAQLQVLAERGHAGRAAASAKELAAAARETAELQQIATGFAAAVHLLLAHGRQDEAREFLRELEGIRGIRGEVRYAANLPGLVRSALALQDRELAVRLAEGVEPRTPLAEHVLSATLAAVAEARGDPAGAADRYAEAARRWQAFGHVPECAYALLGRGRCLGALRRPEAEGPLREARELFAALGYRPALAETAVLLGRVESAAI
jgi:tetratricopeptide (TPR) repeat protein